MATVDVKLDDKVELTLPANGNDYIYILRQVAGGGFQITDYKIKVRNLIGGALPYTDDSQIAAPVEGTQYFNTTDKSLKVYNGNSFVNPSPYRAIVGRISQTGTDNPTTSIGYNTLGITPTFIRTGVGSYEWDISGEGWDLDKVAFNIQTFTGAYCVYGIYNDKITLITTSDNGTTGIDGGLIDGNFELKLYY